MDAVKRYFIGALRAGCLAFEASIITSISGEGAIGVGAVAILGLIGKLIRDKWPTVAGWIPVF